MTRVFSMALELTVDEIIDTLKRSSLTTVLVEGKDDVVVYRWMENEVGITTASFFPCGGREKLLQVFERRSEFQNVKVIFVADKDAYVYTHTPEHLNEIIWTNGYSIENDLYEQKIESLFDSVEETIFRDSLHNFIEYYAFEVENFLDGKPYSFRNHPQHIICEEKNEIKKEFLESINFTSAKKETKDKLKKEYNVLIRGKSLFALLTRILSNQGRQIKHSKMSLLEHCYRTHKSPNFINLIGEVHNRISA